ncbi:tRNA (N6-isopentenyl adenosine(37)-C2)-methylthiotransferase MiaB [bacterium]|nr:tRNA (N6-isopentenyl adenosine(37)-C2)-methylthiotransferase MiaB [bacterium]MCP5462311.1 tRNA (N6-isopentenyl adenosine(37)-C2)-methylthiotransferase MiaB [bacterium]
MGSGDKKVFIQTWGCQMNYYDEDMMKEILEASGYLSIDDEDSADVVLLNTCSVRENAEVKVINKIHRLIQRKQGNESFVIGVVGCMAENRSEYLRKKFPEVQVICGPSSYVDLPILIDRIYEGNSHSESLGIDKREMFPNLAVRGNKLQSFVTIMRGCDNHCSYCVVPKTRGKEKSRTIEEIYDEITVMVEGGCREVTLLGQNVDSYGKGLNVHFVDLLERVNTIKGLERIRFITSHPKDASERLFYAFRDLEKLMPYFHLPLQSGSNGILRKMYRSYTRELYIQKIDKLRSIVPDISLSSDFIVGFPTESEKDFQETCDAYEQIAYDTSFIFKYSPRSGTKAAEMTDDVPKNIKEERNQRLLEIQEKVSHERNSRFVGRTVNVLVEGESKRNPDRYCGRSEHFNLVVFDGNPDMIGKIVPVNIERATALTLFGNPAYART